ncbi:WD repeat-containing protein 92 [Aphanomyces cochlioides]|nr:WD repeat-containing protein 92 [Aphanomyces cochlioides]
MDTTDAPQVIEHITKSLNYTPYDARWIPCSARFVSMGIHPRATGAINVFALQQGELKTVLELEKQHGVKCGTFGASSQDERQLAVGDYAGVMSVYDFEKPEIPVYSAQAHKSIINCIDGCGGLNIGYGAPELVTGGRDGCVRVWDTRVANPVVSLEPEQTEAVRDCWTVAFGNSYNDEERCIAAGYDNGDVKLFDLRTNTMRWETNVQNGVVGVQFDRKDIEMNKLLVTTLESKFRMYDMRTFHPSKGYAYMSEKAHKSTVWQGRFLPQNRDLFMTGGGNGGFNLYKYHYPSSRTTQDADGILMGVGGTVELLNSRVLSTQPIVSMDWSTDREGLCVLSCLDQTVRVYIVSKTHKY